MASLGTLAIGNLDTDSSGGFVLLVGSEPALEVIASANDTTYWYNATNTTSVYFMFYAIANTPADFGTMSTLSVNLRYLCSAAPTNTWNLTAQLYQANHTTSLSNEVTIASSITATSGTNSGAISITGLNTTADKSVWDGALLRIKWDIVRVKGGDTVQRRVTAGEVTGTYNIYTAPSVKNLAALGVG